MGYRGLYKLEKDPKKIEVVTLITKPQGCPDFQNFKISFICNLIYKNNTKVKMLCPTKNVYAPVNRGNYNRERVS